jgi:predicted DNA-binding transcriptional regulator AlpA
MPAPFAERPLLLDARAAARLCGVSRAHFLALSTAGKVPLPVRLGRRTLWRGAELAAWIEAGCPARDRWHTMTRPGPYGGQEGGRK